MEENSTATVTSDYYDADEFMQNLSNIGPLECSQQVDTDGDLSDFIVYSVFINLIGLFGIFGNTISMIILSRPQMKSSINYLLIGLTRCDTVLIIISILIYGLPPIYTYMGLLFDYKFIIYPKIIKYLYPISCMAQAITVYLTLTVTLERYIAVCHPLKVRSFCTYRRAQTAVVLIVIFAIVYNLPKFWEIEVYVEQHWKYNITIYCIYPTPLRNNDYYVTVYIHWMYFFVYYFFPFIALVIFNTAIYRREEMERICLIDAAMNLPFYNLLIKVRKANRDLQQLSRHQRREMGLATMLLCVVVVFLICNILPLASNIHETFIADPPQWMVQFGNLLVTINSSINFIIYVIFGRKFKKIFLKLFCSSRLFGPGRSSPKFQAYDESIVTNTTNIELRQSVRHGNLNRANTINSNNNVFVSNGSAIRQSIKLPGRPVSPRPGMCYSTRSPARSPSQMSGRSFGQNGRNRNENDDSTL